jgi:hypothetical protein
MSTFKIEVGVFFEPLYGYYSTDILRSQGGLLIRSADSVVVGNVLTLAGCLEICDYFKIAPDVYLFSWREKVMPTFGVVLINFKEMRSNGKTYGLDASSGKMINFYMGSVAEPINETYYP